MISRISVLYFFFFFKQKTAYEIPKRDWSSDVCSSDLLPEQEFLRSLDAFPLEYGEIIRTHTTVYGNDPFTNVSISRDDLRRACETQVKSHLVHLRQGFVEAGGNPSAIGELVTAS